MGVREASAREPLTYVTWRELRERRWCHLTHVRKKDFNKGEQAMKQVGAITALLLVLALFTACAHTEPSGTRRVEGFVGSIQGFNCVTQGKVCPVGREDPMIAAETVFVLVMEAGDKYYFIPNLDRGIMARHFNEQVKIEGIKSDQFSSIKARDLYVNEQGRWKKTWSQDLQDEIYYKIMSGHPLDGA